jgi:hypothetical protein
VVLTLALLLVAGVVAGIVLGRGLTTGTTPPPASDGLAWLGDKPAGEAVQVNPANGRAEHRLTVADPGAGFELAQRDGLLVVIGADGTVTLIEVATLTALGGYQGSAGTLALLDDQNLFAVDRAAGTVAWLDPGSGRIRDTWSAGFSLADATIDGHGTLWALRADGRLHRLTVSADRLSGAAPPVTVAGAGPDAVIVGLVEGGVTVLAPGLGGSGTAVRIGTPDDGTTSVPALTGRITAPDRASVAALSVSIDDTSTVVLITPNSVIAVDTSRYGCDRPGESVEHETVTYVSCRGAGLVIALDRQGRHAPPDIRLAPGTDPDLDVANGHFFAIAGDSGVIVDGTGTRTDLSGLRLVPGNVPASAAPRRSRQPGSGQSQAPAGQRPSSAAPPASPASSAPPPGPISGDAVIASLYRAGTTYQYRASLDPPATWLSLTCTVEIYEGGTLVRTRSAPGCVGEVALGIGDGNTWTVIVVGCAGTDCVTSRGEAIDTLERPPPDGGQR